MSSFDEVPASKGVDSGVSVDLSIDELVNSHFK
jgi:hypothetical protein